MTKAFEIIGCFHLENEDSPWASLYKASMHTEGNNTPLQPACVEASRAYVYVMTSLILRLVSAEIMSL